jgi:rhodanese-related sulfurtransferase
MNIFDMFNPNACAIGGRDGAISWSWEEYFENKKKFEEQGKKVVLVDMINHPVEGSTPISNELFDGSFPEGTYFVLYCHSGGSSGMMQKKLSPMFSQYTFVNLAGGISVYPR